MSKLRPIAPLPALAGESAIAMSDMTPVRRHGSIWANASLASLTGAAASVALHATVILVALLVYSNRQQLSRLLETSHEQTIVSQTELSRAQGTGIPHPGIANDPTRDAMQNVDPSVTTSDAFADSRQESLSVTLTQNKSSNSPLSPGNRTLGAIGLNSNARLAPFGPPGGQGTGPRGIFDPPAGAKRIAFVVDGTGTMLGARYDQVKAQLIDTINGLRPSQQFNVLIFTGGDEVKTVSATNLLDATTPCRKKAITFLDQTDCYGQTNPLPALKAALAMKPDLIYFLSDGEFDNLVPYEQVLSTVAQLNANKSVRLNTLLVGDRDKRAEEVLKKLATDNGGTFRFCTADDLQKRNGR